MIRNKYSDNNKILVYKVPYSKAEFVKHSHVSMLISIIIIALFIFAGIINPDSSRTFWIVFPYIFLILPIGFNFLGCFYLNSLEMTFDSVAYNQSIGRIRHSSEGIIVLSLINIVLDIIFIITKLNSINILMELCYLFILILILGTTIFFGYLYGKYFGCIYSDGSNIN